MNFMLSNGVQSTQHDKYYTTKYTHMIPKDALNRIRSVIVFHSPKLRCICGFSFFDKDKKLLWKHGYTTDKDDKQETVVLEENQVIIGVTAKVWPDH